MPAGSSLLYTTKIAKEIERRIRADGKLKQAVLYLSTSVGRSGGAGSAYIGTQYAGINVTLFDKASPLDLLTQPFLRGGPPLRHMTDVDVGLEIRKITKSIPGATIQASEVSGFGGGGAPLQINIIGSDFNSLLKSANLIKDMVSKYHGVYNTDLSFKASQPEVEIRLDRSRAADYGLTLQTVSQAVSDAMEGNNTAKFRDPADGEQYDILVQADDIDRNNVFDIGNIQVGYQDGNAIRLSQVASISEGSGPTRVERLNRQRQISVTGYLLPGTQIGNVSAALTPIIQKMQDDGLLGNNTFAWGGEAQSINEESIYMFTALLLVLYCPTC